MTTLSEGKHAGEFLVSEANNTRSRATGTVKSGENLVAGEVVQLDGNGKLVACDGVLDTAGDLVTAVAGIMYDNVDASASGANADVAGAVYIARDAEVNGGELTYPTESTAGGEEDATNESLKALGIIVR